MKWVVSLHFTACVDLCSIVFPSFRVDSLKTFEFLGLLFLRDLVMVDPDDRIEVSTVTKYYNHQLKDIDENTKLDDMLDIFKVFYLYNPMF